MGATESKSEKTYDDLICMLNTLTTGYDTPYECRDRLKSHSTLISNNVIKLVQEKPGLLINVIKVYPEAKEYFFEILGPDDYRIISDQLNLYHL